MMEPSLDEAEAMNSNICVSIQLEDDASPAGFPAAHLSLEAGLPIVFEAYEEENVTAADPHTLNVPAVETAAEDAFLAFRKPASRADSKCSRVLKQRSRLELLPQHTEKESPDDTRRSDTEHKTSQALTGRVPYEHQLDSAGLFYVLDGSATSRGAALKSIAQGAVLTEALHNSKQVASQKILESRSCIFDTLSEDCEEGGYKTLDQLGTASKQVDQNEENLVRVLRRHAAEARGTHPCAALESSLYDNVLPCVYALNSEVSWTPDNINGFNVGDKYKVTPPGAAGSVQGHGAKYAHTGVRVLPRPFPADADSTRASDLPRERSISPVLVIEGSAPSAATEGCERGSDRRLGRKVLQAKRRQAATPDSEAGIPQISVVAGANGPPSEHSNRTMNSSRDDNSGAFTTRLYSCSNDGPGASSSVPSFIIPVRSGRGVQATTTNSDVNTLSHKSPLTPRRFDAAFHCLGTDREGALDPNTHEDLVWERVNRTLTYQNPVSQGINSHFVSPASHGFTVDSARGSFALATPVLTPYAGDYTIASTFRSTTLVRQPSGLSDSQGASTQQPQTPGASSGNQDVLDAQMLPLGVKLMQEQAVHAKSTASDLLDDEAERTRSEMAVAESNLRGSELATVYDQHHAETIDIEGGGDNRMISEPPAKKTGDLFSRLGSSSAAQGELNSLRGYSGGNAALRKDHYELWVGRAKACAVALILSSVGLIAFLSFFGNMSELQCMYFAACLLFAPMLTGVLVYTRFLSTQDLRNPATCSLASARLQAALWEVTAAARASFFLTAFSIAQLVYACVQIAWKLGDKNGGEPLVWPVTIFDERNLITYAPVILLWTLFVVYLAFTVAFIFLFLALKSHIIMVGAIITSYVSLLTCMMGLFASLDFTLLTFESSWGPSFGTGAVVVSWVSGCLSIALLVYAAYLYYWATYRWSRHNRALHV